MTFDLKDIIMIFGLLANAISIIFILKMQIQKLTDTKFEKDSGLKLQSELSLLNGKLDSIVKDIQDIKIDLRTFSVKLLELENKFNLLKQEHDLISKQHYHK